MRYSSLENDFFLMGEEGKSRLRIISDTGGYHNRWYSVLINLGYPLLKCETVANITFGVWIRTCTVLIHRVGEPPLQSGLHLKWQSCHTTVIYPVQNNWQLWPNSDMDRFKACTTSLVPLRKSTSWSQVQNSGSEGEANHLLYPSIIYCSYLCNQVQNLYVISYRLVIPIRW